MDKTETKVPDLTGAEGMKEMKETLEAAPGETLEEKIAELEEKGENPEEKKSVPDSEDDTVEIEDGGDGQDTPGFDPESATAEVEEEAPGPAVCTDELSEDENPEEDVVVEDITEEIPEEVLEMMKKVMRERSGIVNASAGIITASVAGALVTSRPGCAKREADILELAKDVKKIVEAVISQDW